MHKALLFLFTLFPAANCFGQSDTALGEVYDYLYDFRLSDNNEIESNEYLFENNPVNVNTATLQTLMQLPGIDYSTAVKIIDRRDKNGRFFSMTELLQVEGLDKALIRSLQPYLILDEGDYSAGRNAVTDSSNGPKYSKADIRSGFSVRQSSVSAEYTGPAYRQYNKIRLSGENWKASLKTEKDPGEKEFADFKSFFVQIKNAGVINSLTAGDYYIEFGQGLSKWSPGGNYINRGDASYARSGRGVIPASGFNETGFLRGLSLELKYYGFSLTGFASSSKRDAEKDTAGYIVSLPQDGYHRTGPEISRKESCRELTYGMLARYSNDSIFSAGAILNWTEYNIPARPKASPDILNGYFLAASEYSLNLSKLHLSGEAAYAVNRVSICNIMSYEISDGVNLSFRQNTCRWGNGTVTNAYSPFSGPVRINDLQTGIRSEMPWGVLYLLYAYKTVKKPDGSEILRWDSRLTYSGYFGKSFNGELKVNLRKEKSELPGAVIFSETESILNIRADLRCKAGSNLFFHWRADYCRSPFALSQKGGNGAAFYNETKFKLSKILVISTRLTIYKTDSYASRLYEIESDVSGTLFSSLLYGTGAAWYIITELSLWPKSKVAVKFADETKKINQSENGQLVNTKRFNLQIDISL